MKFGHSSGIHGYLNKPVQRIKKYQSYIKVISLFMIEYRSKVTGFVFFYCWL